MEEEVRQGKTQEQGNGWAELGTALGRAVPGRGLGTAAHFVG